MSPFHYILQNEKLRKKRTGTNGQFFNEEKITMKKSPKEYMLRYVLFLISINNKYPSGRTSRQIMRWKKLQKVPDYLGESNL